MRGRSTSYLINLLSTQHHIRGLKTAAGKSKTKPRAAKPAFIDDEDDNVVPEKFETLQADNAFLEERNDELMARINTLKDELYVKDNAINCSKAALAEAHVMLRKVQEDLSSQLPQSLKSRIESHLSAFESQKQTHDEVKPSRKLT